MVDRERLTGLEDIYTHSLRKLLRLTDRSQIMEANRDLWPRFVTVNLWQPAWRYTANLSNRDEAADFVAASRAVVEWLGANV